VERFGYLAKEISLTVIIFACNFDSYAFNFESHKLNFESHKLNFDSYALKFESYALNFDSYALSFESYALNFDRYALNLDGYFNRVKRKNHLSNRLHTKFSSYLTEKTVQLHYKENPLNAA
jgi:hypothetical protein